MGSVLVVDAALATGVCAVEGCGLVSSSSSGGARVSNYPTETVREGVLFAAYGAGNHRFATGVKPPMASGSVSSIVAGSGGASGTNVSCVNIS